eukprot:gnl/TRDRNA2_/TRDRNA2_171373_c1_seq2.p1 gnl/TRDRNA2_/TRDRNA2_171373_c1~~gnl/TRDRNA2_/TRDRNA2_171373_c1_seq2.p1  ORF type:complete len:306 (+),score=11.93 gnl/TRDRNA2_/TRDRNA2_171373_c1_seq2:143-1060(+)
MQTVLCILIVVQIAICYAEADHPLLANTTGFSLKEDLHGFQSFSEDLGFYSNDVFFSFSGITFPETPDRWGTLFEAGCNGRGTWLGITSKREFRLSAGDGGDSNQADGGDIDTAVVIIPLPDDKIPLDGQDHEVCVFIYTSQGKVELYIDSKLVRSAQSSSGTFECNEWHGPDLGGFGKTNECVVRGGNRDEWPVDAKDARMRMWVSSIVAENEPATCCHLLACDVWALLVGIAGGGVCGVIIGVCCCYYFKCCCWQPAPEQYGGQPVIIGQAQPVTQQVVGLAQPVTQTIVVGQVVTEPVTTKT